MHSGFKLSKRFISAVRNILPNSSRFIGDLSLEANLDEQNALFEDIISQELDVCLGWHLPEAMAHQVLDMGVPIVHLSETHIEHPLSVSPIGLRKVAEELAHYLADA